MFKRYIVEFGTGADIHGMDVNKAAKRAVKSAISQSCLCGLVEILGIKIPDESIKIDLIIATPYPERIDPYEVKAVVPIGEVDIKVISGGLEVKGHAADSFGQGDKIVLVNAALTVYVDVK